jgi:hypothetical protein
MCCDEGGTIFSFTGRYHNDVNNGADGMDHAIFNGGVVGIAKVYNEVYVILKSQWASSRCYQCMPN